MKIITVIVGVFTITTAVKVPPYWIDSGAISPNRLRPHRQQGSEILTQPYVVNKINSATKNYYNKRHHNPKKNTEQLTVAGSSTGWVPIFPVAAPPLNQPNLGRTSVAFETPTYRLAGDHNRESEKISGFDNSNPKITSGFEPTTHKSGGSHYQEPKQLSGFGFEPTTHKSEKDHRKEPKHLSSFGFEPTNHKSGGSHNQEPKQFSGFGLEPTTHKSERDHRKEPKQLSGFGFEATNYKSRGSHNQEPKQFAGFELTTHKSGGDYKQEPSQFSSFFFQPTIHKSRGDDNQEPKQVSIFGLEPQKHFQKEPSFESPIYKNFRDDKTHEPLETHRNKNEPQEEPSEVTVESHRTHKENPISSHEEPSTVTVESHRNHKRKPISSHEEPSEVPTRPVYPGEGKWAKKGTKHRPYVSNHRFAKLKKSPKNPEGYETFVENKNLFKQEGQKFRNNIEEFPQKHNLGSYIEDVENEENVEVTSEFVPTKLYAQVRRSESEQHLPSEEADDARLREVVKDSKIQTVYTEEGYEDIAYDHAGHEKNAEQDEGFAEFDKEIEKKKKIDNEDSEVAGSEFVGDPVKVNKNKFITTKEVKTTEVKDKGDGEEMEISSEIKLVVSPNNATKTHKYLKIFPKVYRYDRVENRTSTPKNSETEELPLESGVKYFFEKFNSKRVKRFVNDFPKLGVDTGFIDKIKHLEAPSTERSTTTKYPYYNDPGVNPDSPLRYSEDLGNIPKKTEDDLAFYHQADRIECSEVEDDIDPIPERVKNAQTRAEEMEETKDVQELAKSPRLGNLGDKIDCFKIKYFGENPLDSPIFDEATIAPVTPIFGFFQQKFSNPLVKQNGDLKKNQLGLEELNQKKFDTPLVKRNEDLKKNQLGLVEQNRKKFDSPLVKRNEDLKKNQLGLEEQNRKEIAAPLVKRNENLKKNQFGLEEQNGKKIATALVKRNEDRKRGQKEDLVNLQLGERNQKGFKGNFSKEQQNNEIEEVATTPNVDSLGINILTDVIGKISSTPKIPQDVEIIDVNAIRESPPTEVAPVTIITTPKYTIDLQPKHIYDQIDLLQYLPVLGSETILLNSTVLQREGKKLEESEETTPNSELPTSQALLLKKRRRRIRPRRPLYNIFDVTRYLPTINPYLNRYIQATTAMPKYKILSEVHYKDEIRPDEQLNVFSDVINNIKNSTKDPLQLAASSDRIAVKLNSYHRMKVPPRIVHIKNSEINSLDNIEETNSFYLTTTTTTSPILATTLRGKKYFLKKNNENFYEDLFTQDSVQYDNIELLKIDAAKTTTKMPYLHQSLAPVVEETTEETDEEVLGLMPPKLNSYKTIFSPKLDKPLLKPMNYFYVQGMKPPSKQEVRSYSDFKLHNNLKMKQGLRGHRIRRNVPSYSEIVRYLNRFRRNSSGYRDLEVFKNRRIRSASRPGYSEVMRNRNKPIDVDDDEEVVVEDDDDYVPHRPKNYHYDEKTGRIVYENSKKEEEEEESEEYLEVTEAPLPKPTRRNPVTTPRFVDNSEEPSYVEYVKKLKNAANYMEIPDPTTTEKGEEVVATTTTTSKPVSTKPPEFLDILAKVRSDSGYKSIEDKKKSKTTTTTQAPPEEIIEESQLETVQNSPGGQTSGQIFQIFDINDYLPKVKTYSPRTSIDTSKYKNIERPSVPLRHNLSSRYNSEEEALEDVNTSRVPILMEKNEDNPKIEIEETTTQLTTTTRKIKTRPRTRKPSTTPAPVTVSESVPQHDKPKRVFPRKRPTRIKIRTTTPDETEDTTKILRRRHQPELFRREGRVVTSDEVSLQTRSNSSVPGRIEPRSVENGEEFRLEDRIDNFEDTIVVEKLNSSISEPETAKSLVVEVDENGGEAKIVTPDVSPMNVTVPNRGEARKIEDVQVFQKFDETKKHGGNYKKENEDKDDGDVEESGEVKRLTDVVPKPIAFYTDPKLPKNVNQLMEIGIGGVEEIEEEIGEEKEDYGENDEDLEEDGEKKTTKMKKPVFVKDPSKRLYYYAPI